MSRPEIRRSLVDHKARRQRTQYLICLEKKWLLKIGDSVCLRAMKIDESPPISVLEREYYLLVDYWRDLTPATSPGQFSYSKTSDQIP